MDNRIMKRYRNVKRASILMMLTVLGCLLFWPSLGLAQTDQNVDFPLIPQADIPHPIRGTHCFVSNGVSLVVEPDTPTAGSFRINVPGKPVVAYMYWSGRDGKNGSATKETIETIDVNIQNLSTATAETLKITATDAKYSPAYAHSHKWFTYSYDLLAHLPQAGDYQFTVQPMNIRDNHGVGIVVVYEGDVHACPEQEVYLFWGGDYVYGNKKSGDYGLHRAQPTCIEFPPAQRAREVEFQMFVGGIKDPERSDTIWSATGPGPKPDSTTNLADLPGATALHDRLKGLAQTANETRVEFDNYDTLVQDPANVIKVNPGDRWACIQLESPLGIKGPREGISAVWNNLVVRVTDLDIKIQALTNGADAADPFGADVPKLAVGAPVTWTYILTNTGSVDFDANQFVVTDTITGAPLSPLAKTLGDQDDQFEPGEVWRYQAIGAAQDLRTLNAAQRVAGCARNETPTRYAFQNTLHISTTFTLTDTTFTLTDTTHYCNPKPRPPWIQIEKAVNGVDADVAPGPPFAVGTALTWIYTITNGPVDVFQVTVTDDDPDVQIDCRDENSLQPKDALQPNESMICTAFGDAQKGLYQNIGMVTAQTADGTAVTDSDFSHYTGIETFDLDWGDAPDAAPDVGPNNYQTLESDNGPRHKIIPELYIGGGVDKEDDGQPEPHALGDDQAQSDDEYAVANHGCFVLGKPIRLAVPVTNQLTTAAQLHGWIDFDGNGDFALAEHQQFLVNSTSMTATLDFGPPPIPSQLSTFMRLRLSTDAAAAQPFGPAADGEVEDHFLTFVTPAITPDVKKIFRNIDQLATLNANVTASCGSVAELSVCFEIPNDTMLATCYPIKADGRATYSYRRGSVGDDKVAIWIDLDDDQEQSRGEPATAVEVTWQNPAITVETLINGQPARTPSDGPEIVEGTAITWTYQVRNSGTVALTNVVVRDETLSAIKCQWPSLNPNATEPCNEPALARTGVQTNTVFATGISASGVVTNSDTSYYTGIPAPTEFDWGDAPDSNAGVNNYQTLAVNNGPHHAIEAGLFIGDSMGDAEGDGQPSPGADGDDTNATPDDEDGIEINACFVRGKPAVLNVRATNQLDMGARLHGWADFDSDGRFADGVSATVDVPMGSSAQFFALDFAQPLIPDIPAAFVRLRLSSDPQAAQPTGRADNGEVEDHLVKVVTPTIVVSPTTASAAPGESVLLTATVNVPQSCASPAGLSVCWDVNGARTDCRTLTSTGISTFTHTVTDTVTDTVPVQAADGLHMQVDEVRVWIDIEPDQTHDGGEPSATAQVDARSKPYTRTVTLTPITTTLPIGARHELTATVADLDGNPASGEEVLFSVTGVHGQPPASKTTNALGQALFDYVGRNVGQDEVTATLASGAAKAVSAAISWRPGITYSIVLTPTDYPRVVGTDALITATVTDNSNNPVKDQKLAFEVSGVNTIPVTNTEITNEFGQTQIRYDYNSDKNSALSDRITVTIHLTGSSVSFSHSDSIDWIPISMTVQADQTGQPSADITIAAAPYTDIADTVSVMGAIEQENLEKSERPISATLPIPVQQEGISGQEQSKANFTAKTPFAPLPFKNRIYPGCDIKLADPLSPWQFKLWIDLNRDGKATGQEPTCIVEAPTADASPRFSGRSTADEVILIWSTGVEIDLLGFNLYRARDPAGPYTLVNENLILAVGDALGADYHYADQPPAAGLYFYQIESITNAKQISSEPIVILYPTPAHQIYLPLASH